MIRKKLLHQEIKMPTSKHDNATLSLWILAALFLTKWKEEGYNILKRKMKIQIPIKKKIKSIKDETSDIKSCAEE